MGKFNNFRSKIADDLELPNDAMSDNFNLRMHGNKKVIIENHSGIIIYEDNEVGIRTIENNIFIKGSKFKIEEINSDSIVVKGNIKEIMFAEKE